MLDEFATMPPQEAWCHSTASRPYGRWDDRFIKLAEMVANWSKDPSTKCGAVITTPSHRILSVGFNGFPRGVEDTEERLSNREIKYRMVVHAEENALLFANSPVTGARIYTWPFMPCSSCAAKVIQAGIAEVIAPWCSLEHPRWGASFQLSLELFNEAGVKVLFGPEVGGLK